MVGVLRDLVGTCVHVWEGSGSLVFDTGKLVPDRSVQGHA